MMLAVDAPPEVAALFHEWLASGRPWHLERPLIEALRPHRGTWLVSGEFVFSLCKMSDRRDDVIRFNRRSMFLGRNRGETDGTETRAAAATV